MLPWTRHGVAAWPATMSSGRILRKSIRDARNVTRAARDLASFIGPANRAELASIDLHQSKAGVVAVLVGKGAVRHAGSRIVRQRRIDVSRRIFRGSVRRRCRRRGRVAAEEQDNESADDREAHDRVRYDAIDFFRSSSE